MELLMENSMNDEVKITETAAPRRGRPPKAAEDVVEPVNTIVNLEVPKIVVTRAEEPVEEAEVPMSEQTRLEMEMGRKILAGFR